MAELLKEVLQLPKTERWSIAMKILDSIREEEGGGLSSKQWKELEQRIHNIETGKVKPLSEDEFWVGLNRKNA